MVNLINNILNAVNNSAVNSVASIGKSTEPVLECNYEENCTALYEAIEAANNDADYAKLLICLETGSWVGYSYPNTGSPTDQAKTWVTRFDAVDEKKVKWSQLPLHLAIVCGAPTSIIKQLVKLYPKALRCTDDQHMLPLHLALRHGATDEVVAFLLKEFPDAAYAKGKNNRTPVDCAMRAKDKHRGMILEIFLERTKKRLSSKVIEERATLKNMVESKNTTLETLKTDVVVKESIIENLRKELTKIRHESNNFREKEAATESDFISKIQKLENCHTELEEEVKEVTDKLRDEKLVETLELQVKIDQLESEKHQLEKAQRKARKTESSLRKELDNVIEMVTKTSSTESWTKVKRDVEDLKRKRLTMGLVQAKDDISTLKKDLARTLDDDKSVGNRSLASIRKSVEKLQVAERSVKTAEDLHDLQSEVDSLKEQLKSLADSSRTKDELAALKKSIEMELRSSEGKTHDELEALKAAVKLVNESDLQTKTAAELATVKNDLQHLKTTIAERQLENTTKKDLESLCESIQKAMVSADSKTIIELKSLKEKVDAINDKCSSTSTKDEMIAFKKDVDAAKDELKAIEISCKIQEEAAGLKRSVEDELQKSQGKTQQELMLLKQSIKQLVEKGFENKDTAELSKVKGELSVVKDKLKTIEVASQTQVELAVLKKALEYQIQSSVGKTAKELFDMKKAVDAINMESKESKKIKSLLTEEIKLANNKTEKNLVEMKKVLDKINLTKLESKNIEEWDGVRHEMEKMKAELQEKQVIEISAAEQELIAMKKVVEAIKTQEIKSSSDLAALREEVSMMRDELVVGTTSEWKMRQAIEALKNEARDECGLPPKPTKDKAGLKKFLSRRFRRTNTDGSVNARSRASMSFGSSFDDSIYGGDRVESHKKGKKNDVQEEYDHEDSTPILPPSLSTSEQQNPGPTNSDDSLDEPIVLEQVDGTEVVQQHPTITTTTVA